MTIKPIKAWTIVNKKNPKLDTNFIFASKKDIELDDNEMWVQVLISPTKSPTK
jgi:hypothetical protein